MTDDDWKELVRAAGAVTAAPVQGLFVTSFLRSASNPIQVACDDQRLYLVKTEKVGREFVNDHIAGLFGRTLDAPVGEVRVVSLTQEFVRIVAQRRPELGPGLYHGSVWLDRVRDALDCEHVHDGDNRRRFARLAILYGWLHADDHQFLYTLRKPFRVYSVDHGQFLGGESWSVNTLEDLPPARADAFIVQAVALTDHELGAAAKILRRVDDRRIAEVVAAPPVEWGISEHERIALARVLAKRRDEMQSIYAHVA